MSASAHRAVKSPLTLTIILAGTSQKLGIGKKGILPWKIKSEMAYFARVTRYVPSASPLPPVASSSLPNIRVRTPPPTEIDAPALEGQTGEILPTEIEVEQEGEYAGEGGEMINVLVMGRKTYESIPAKFRPLEGRINIVISRLKRNKKKNGTDGGDGRDPGPYYVSSLEQAVEFIEKSAGGKGSGGARIWNVFVIGGAEIYGLAMQSGLVRRILLTEIFGEEERWGCDVFFPREFRDGKEWVRCGHEALEGFVGGIVPRGRQREGEVEFEYQMWERVE